MKLNKVDEKVIAELKAGGELGMQELAEKTGESSKKVFKSLKKLFEHELIETKARKYKLCPGKKAAEDEAEAEEPE